jgi:hypothetical protein
MKAPALKRKGLQWRCRPCAHREIRTPTPKKAPPPQDGVSTNFTMCADWGTNVYCFLILYNMNFKGYLENTLYLIFRYLDLR